MGAIKDKMSVKCFYCSMQYFNIRLHHIYIYTHTHTYSHTYTFDFSQSNSQDLRKTSFCPLIWTYYSFDILILAYYIVGKQAYLDVENE